MQPYVRQSHRGHNYSTLYRIYGGRNNSTVQHSQFHDLVHAPSLLATHSLVPAWLNAKASILRLATQHALYNLEVVIDRALRVQPVS